MKLHQPVSHSTIFFILEPDLQDIPVHVAFDDEETAKAYLSRFNTFSDAQIVECHLNPGFYTDITRDCYFIQLNMRNDAYIIGLANDLQRSELAINGHYFIEEEQICIYVMAVSENEAIKIAYQIKENAIGNRKSALTQDRI